MSLASVLVNPIRVHFKFLLRLSTGQAQRCLTTSPGPVRRCSRQNSGTHVCLLVYSTLYLSAPSKRLRQR